MMWNKVRLAVPVLFASLLVSACYQVNMELDFNADGSGTMNMELTVDSSLMRFATLEGGTAADACRDFADEATGSADFPTGDVHVDHVLQVDGSCVVTVDGSFTADEFSSSDDANLSVTEDGWSLTMGGFAASMDEAISEIGTDDLGLFDDVALAISVRLPGTPSDDHNAHRVEDGRFIWEFAGAGLEDVPVALRASSKADASNDTWVLLVVGGLVGAAAVLGVVWVTRRRRRAAREAAVVDEVSGNDTLAGSREPWTAWTPEAEDAEEDLPHSRYRPPTEET